ncbi:RING finger and transmembrane domain-containing protein 2 [Orchesella cincta]|uniref:RING finger and transmembrane domain-containing protein 2 n=1 Tax=Orchesella cincta TaxID=48709 RepID=A0A1D2ND04_ORCCI|nr:RING finger and transmembrane domain-containing protein 2 [Orchesella cincta]
MTDSSANCSVEIESAANSGNISRSDIVVAVEINERSTPPVARVAAPSSENVVSNSEGTPPIPAVSGASNSATATLPTASPQVNNVESGISDQRDTEARRHSSPRDSEQPTSEMSGNPGDHVHSRSNSRRQRNGLFGINIDLNFDPSWLVPTNVAGRSISSLSMLPEWARPPVNISIPNREIPSTTAPESRQGHHHHHHHHASSSGLLGTAGGVAGSRLTSHSSPPNENWNSSFASSGHSSSSTSTPNIQHHHGISRTRHMVTSMRSVDEDLDADYNPVSNIDLGAGRDRSSNSYVIDMDSPMGGWVEDEGAAGVHGEPRDDATHPDATNAGSALLGGMGPTENNGGGGARRSSSDISLPTADGNVPSMADAATGANERTRAAEILRDAPETRAFINEISRYTTIRPFIVINFLKGVFDHGTSILAFLALVVTFSHANSMVKKEVSKQRKRNLLYLSMIVINLAACVAFIYYIFNEMELYYALVFLPTSTDMTSFWSLMWAVGVTDYVAKFGTVLVKIFVVALPGCIVPFQKRGKYYLFIEHSSQLYRSFLPVYPWMFYLVSAYEGTARMFGLFLAGLYVFFKISDSFARIKDWLKSLEKLLSNVHYGTNPTVKQLDSAGTICPICHDNYASPTRLACSHIFCEECVATWFDRERTCPMCRAKVVDDPTYRDGSTSQYVQLF